MPEGGGTVIRYGRHAILVAFAIGVAVLGSPARESNADPPPAPPAEYQALYDELSQNLTEFEDQLDAEWDGAVGNNRFAQTLAAANGNKAIALLSQQSWAGSLAMLDAYEAMGVEVIKLEMHYPVFTQAFHDYLAAHPPPGYNPYAATVGQFIGQPTSFFNRIAAEIRSRGLGLWIEHGTLFTDYSPTPPTGYFAEMRTAGLAAARQRYSDERAAEAALTVAQLAPDHYTILEEPETQNDNFGYFPGNVSLYGPNEWQDFVETAAADIAAAAPGSTTELGAGMGTWDSGQYVQLFSPMPELDYIDMHIYALETIGRNYLQDALAWADYVRSVDPAKKLMIGEAWLYKASVNDLVTNVPYNTLFARDVWSFWEPLDRQYHDILFKLMHQKDFELVMPYWVQYYFAYIDHGDPTVEGMSGPQLITEAGQRAAPNLLSLNFTDTGEKIVELIAATEDTDSDGQINWYDANDDNDLLTDATEGACGSDSLAATSVPERIDGPFAAVDDDGDTQVDEPLPGGAANFDCDGDGYKGSAENHVFSYLAQTNGDQKTCQEYDTAFPNMTHKPSKRWPADLNGSAFSLNKVNIQDLAAFTNPIRYLNKDVGTDPDDVRFDIVPGSTVGADINVADLAALTSGATGAPPMLDGARAFGGPVCPWAP